jgi:hypothetical protein
LTRQQTLDSVIKWKKDIDQKVFLKENVPIPCLLIGNKVRKKKIMKERSTKRSGYFNLGSIL